MSIMSAYDFDDSEILYRRFAELVLSYVDELPEPSKLRIAQIPLENFHRLFEMYRYDAFSDGNHSGVLDMDRSDEFRQFESVSWHTEIKAALTDAFDKTFGRDNDEVIDEMEDVLKQLSHARPVLNTKKDNAKKFFNHFINGLAAA